MFLAMSQLTGPPRQDSMSANWRSVSANCCGLPIPERAHRARAGDTTAGAPRAAGRPRAAGTLAALVFRLIGQAETERAFSHRWLCGRMEGS